MSLGNIKNSKQIVVKNVKIDIKEEKQKKSILDPVKSLYYFKNLKQDVQPLYGLQDWPAKEWRAAFSSAHGKELSKTLGIATGYENFLKHLENGLLLKDWVEILKFQNRYMNGKFETDPNRLYVHEDVLLNSIHRQMFPLGIFDEQDWEFAVKNSGIHSIGHSISNRSINRFMFLLMILTGIGLFVFLFVILTQDYWRIEHTVQNNSTSSSDIVYRTKERGTFASVLGGLTFSLIVNASLDVFAKIDQSTSTALIGVFLGNTWGFVLDNVLGTDEGYREYLWNSWDGMKYGLGSVYTVKFMRYVITLFFDIFFTVILFKQFYPLLLKTAGFSTNGREWIANSFVSTIISLTTYQVYANMTRFQWAYPSGNETIFNQWISGPTMLLATVVMNMVYLTTETRTKQGEPGINDPVMKMLLTIATFLMLAFLQMNNALDPTIQKADFEDESTSKPLYGVCETQSLWVQGFLMYQFISFICLGVVIFGTSKLVLFKSSFRTKVLLLFIYMIINSLIVLFFAFVPFFSHNEIRNATFLCS